MNGGDDDDDDDAREDVRNATKVTRVALVYLRVFEAQRKKRRQIYMFGTIASPVSSLE